MSRTLVDRIAEAVLYEGYILYPYRPSVKNRQRWTFGALYPEAYCRAQGGSDASASQTECLARGGPDTVLEATVRFLHLTARQVRELAVPLAEWPADAEPLSWPVEVLRVGDRLFHTWQEAEERQVALGELRLDDVLDRPRRKDFTFPGRRWLEPVRGPAGDIVGVLAREQEAVGGAVEVSAAPAAEGLFRVKLRILNSTGLEDGAKADREEALLRSLASTHTVLGVRGGRFVSLLDPPEPWHAAAAACQNVGTWPVLVGEEGQADTMLSAPIILYDYPQVAPESPGNFFDGTEIDEMLTLRILTLTDDEKRAMAAVDERARALLTRTEGLGGEQLMQLHGAVRCLRPVGEGEAHD
jgi:hydrogenase maturation protease